MLCIVAGIQNLWSRNPSLWALMAQGRASIPQDLPTAVRPPQKERELGISQAFRETWLHKTKYSSLPQRKNAAAEASGLRLWKKKKIKGQGYLFFIVSRPFSVNANLHQSVEEKPSAWKKHNRDGYLALYLGNCFIRFSHASRMAVLFAMAKSSSLFVVPPM